MLTLSLWRNFFNQFRKIDNRIIFITEIVSMYLILPLKLIFIYDTDLSHFFLDCGSLGYKIVQPLRHLNTISVFISILKIDVDAFSRLFVTIQQPRGAPVYICTAVKTLYLYISQSMMHHVLLQWATTFLSHNSYRIKNSWKFGSLSSVFVGYFWQTSNWKANSIIPSTAIV